jgi:hypothetical protein
MVHYKGAVNFSRLLQDLCTAEKESKHGGEDHDGKNNADPGDNESFFKLVMKEAKHELYPCCTKFSKLSFVVKLLHMKSLYRIFNSAIL